jgi:L-rhamnose mutarotase
VWPDVLKRIADSNIHDYTIYYSPELGCLFSHFVYTGDDWEKDMAAIAADENTRKWWAVTDPWLVQPKAARIDSESVVIPAKPMCMLVSCWKYDFAARRQLRRMERAAARIPMPPARPGGHRWRSCSTLTEDSPAGALGSAVMLTRDPPTRFVWLRVCGGVGWGNGRPTPRTHTHAKPRVYCNALLR